MDQDSDFYTLPAPAKDVHYVYKPTSWISVFELCQTPPLAPEEERGAYKLECSSGSEPWWLSEFSWEAKSSNEVNRDGVKVVNKTKEGKKEKKKKASIHPSYLLCCCCSSCCCCCLVMIGSQERREKEMHRFFLLLLLCFAKKKNVSPIPSFFYFLFFALTFSAMQNTMDARPN